MILILLGPPGAGKGTQARRLQEEFHLKQIATGDLVREEIASGSDLGKRIKAIIDRGEYPDDQIFIDMFRREMSKPAKGFICDGFPRTINQAQVLDDFLTEIKKPLTAVIEMDVDQELLIKRLSGRFNCKECKASYNDYFSPTLKEGVCDICGSTEFFRRSDDNPEAVKRRFEVYREQTSQLVDFYQAKGLLYRVNGNNAPDEVHAEIVRLIHKLTSSEVSIKLSSS
ncbi:adenylate kinase [Candidatus Nucleicultrix amoebiphila]|jgi:adenylate kinase|uniref:Adenylate kinase n=1 Tax=Candidatus Nucleicultrix amoebiphila FS5 TaxID=1414854 RepID=A0A1W6N681_9PROT|nr:adenylate kinase [Candidatus Nucleicultrix amoebiphila]ARN85343.1 hypothetical protein GQ61_08645 [Candidatus Nucleicultrix amoebiphila FS5]